MSSRRVQWLNYAVSFLVFLCCSSIRSCRAQNNQSGCVSSSCGDIGSISYPFRLKTDPSHCGKPGFELDCRNNQTVITFKSKSFNVESISYSNYTIRMTDPGIQESNFCSSPDYSLVSDDLPYELMTYESDFTELNNFVVFVNCKNAVNSPKYILLNDTSCRNSSGGYRYLTVGDIGNYSLLYEMSVLVLEDSCSVDKFAWASLTGTPLGAGNASEAGIRRSLAYGFELSWHQVMCEVCNPWRSRCIMEGYQVTCSEEVCFESTPYEEKSFRCKLEYLSPFFFFYGGGGILAVIVLRFFIGLCCIGVLASRERKRRHLWEMKHKDDEVYSSEMNAEDIPK